MIVNTCQRLNRTGSFLTTFTTASTQSFLLLRQAEVKTKNTFDRFTSSCTSGRIYLSHSWISSASFSGRMKLSTVRFTLWLLVLTFARISFHVAVECVRRVAEELLAEWMVRVTDDVRITFRLLPNSVSGLDLRYNTGTDVRMLWPKSLYLQGGSGCFSACSVETALARRSPSAPPLGLSRICDIHEVPLVYGCRCRVDIGSAFPRGIRRSHRECNTVPRASHRL